METTQHPSGRDRGGTVGRQLAEGAVDLAYERMLVEMTGVVVDTPSMHDVLEQLIVIAQRSSPGVTAISVTAHEDGEYLTAATTSAAAQEVDEHEYVTEAGPCVDAIETGELQLSDDVLADDRWPTFSDAATARGFRSAAGVPLVAGGRIVGAINLYAAEPNGLREVLPLTERMAGPLATVVANALAMRRVTRLGDSLQGELAQLAAVEQAIGILMAHRSWDARTAERALERTAAATGRSMEDVALRIVAHARGPGRKS
jgi:transcriptional regulator with GAF, ATPase, and Fis domain